MNRQALYAYDRRRPNTVYGPFLELATAETYAGDELVLTRLTGNEIASARIRVVAPR